jgi:damage-control phosphatase, subfamily I
MKLHAGCIPCIINQAYRFAEMAGVSDPGTLTSILYEVTIQLQNMKTNLPSAPYFTPTVQAIVGKYADVHGAIQMVKQRNLNEAKKYVRYLEQMINGATDKLDMAIRAAIAGNTIDIGANPNHDINKEISGLTSNTIDLESLGQFRNDFENAETILIIADNYEEGLFDKLLLHELRSKECIYAVRSAEVLNDITFADAKHLRIDKMCEVIESGSVISGTDIRSCTQQFRDIFYAADIVIAKGQGNYETLSDADRPIYFMFKVKCSVIAGMCGRPMGTSMLYYHDGTNNNRTLQGDDHVKGTTNQRFE